MNEELITLNPDKTELIDYVFQRCNPRSRSFADLGALWGVHGGYTFYALKKHRMDRAVLVDTGPTERFLTQAARSPKLKFIKGNFGGTDVRDQVGKVGAIFMFDVLLHQVAPNWDEILARYAGSTQFFCIYNQQWTKTPHTVRLLDLGEDEYFRNVPHERDHPEYKNLFSILDQMSPEPGKPWRDHHNYWQWGITDGDLLQTMKKLGYRLLMYKNCGQFGSLPNCENHSFVFMKK